MGPSRDSSPVVVANPIVLPTLKWAATESYSSRNGAKVRAVAIHRWGAPYKGIPAEALSYQGVIRFFEDTKNQVSSTYVYPGTSVANGYEATQMVQLAAKAWTEAFYNSICVSIESADAIWLGHDPLGMQLLARQVGWLLHHFNLTPQWVNASQLGNGETGFCRHADLGSAGGGHFDCPTTDMALWGAFCQLVIHEYNRGGYRLSWGR